ASAHRSMRAAHEDHSRKGADQLSGHIHPPNQVTRSSAPHEAAMPRTRRRRIDKRLGSFGFLSAAAIVGALGFAGCSSADTGASDVCQSDTQYFAEKIWAPLMAQKCVSCH